MNKVQLIPKSECSENTIKAFPHAGSCSRMAVLLRAGWYPARGDGLQWSPPPVQPQPGAATSRAESGPCPRSVPQETEEAFSPAGSVISNRN